MNKPYAIEFKELTKSFGQILANDRVSLRIKSGTIHALIGENGAGKTTLMNQLFGLLKPTSGTILINNKEVSITSPNVASELGLSMVHQHFQLVPNHSVLENIVLGDVVKTKLGPVNYKRARIKLLRVAQKYNLQIDPDMLVKKASVGMQQRIEILKVLYKGASILIFDEPTAMLTPVEISGLLQLFRDLKNQGKTIVFISHKLAEVKRIADAATVLRKGQVVGSFAVATTSAARMAEMMVGRKLTPPLAKVKHPLGPKLLALTNITIRHHHQPKIIAVRNLSLSIHSGEIVALAGVEGNGQLELVNGLFGLQKLVSGQVKVWHKDDQNALQVKELGNKGVRSRYDAGLSLVPENRHRYAVLATSNLFTNAIMQAFYKRPYAVSGFLHARPKVAWTRSIVSTFDVRGARNGSALLSELSGGNQQKFVVGREMTRAHDVIILFQPTRGLDVGAIEFIHRKIIEERNKGKAVLLVSYELSEIMALADRVAVINQGQLVNVAPARELNHETIGRWMAGIS